MKITFINTERMFTREWFRMYLQITIGAFILAAGFVFFVTPYRIVPGGVYGISIVIHYLTRGVFSFAPDGLPIGTMGLIMNIPLTILGIKILGPRFGVKTIVGFVLSSFFIDFLTFLWGTEPLVPNEALLSAIFGGVLIGLGLGVIFRTRATSGGSDIIGMILEKYTHLPLGQLMIAVDSTIVLIGLAAFQDWKIPLLSWIVIYISGKVIDATLEGLHYNKTLLIITDHYDEVKNTILYDIGRGATLIRAQGMYSDVEKKLIFSNMSRREAFLLKEKIKKIDPRAFITIINTNEILGEGFKTMQETTEL
ncbi:MAG: YitT family protein [Bacteroidales bacterium]|nr:YitT family protein [Bacteroidales bacterium]